MLSLMAIIVLIAIGISVCFTLNNIKKQDRSKSIGNEGENIILNELSRLSDIGRPFSNLYITFNNGSTTEIDIVFVTYRGIYVIESKNYNGKIICDNIEDTNWRVLYRNGQIYGLYNPILQNKTHINGLKHAIGVSDNSLIPLVVFGSNADIESIKYSGVIKVNNLVEYIVNDYKTRDTVFTQNDVEYLLNAMQNLQNANVIKKYSHVKQVKQRQRR